MNLLNKSIVMRDGILTIGTSVPPKTIKGKNYFI
jgi:hypothetical protein